MAGNPLLELEALGQSVWLDFLRRGMFVSGQLESLRDQDGLSGVTANPSIFEKAIGDSHDYDDAIDILARQGKNAEQIYETLATEDVRRAADLFRPVYDRTKGADGFASLEVSPRLAHDTDGTVAEALRLWREIGRPNAMIKVPATRAGLPAIRRLIAAGINVNVTLLFGLPRYEAVMDAYLAGLEDRIKRGQPVRGIASVASFFLSRIDVLIDPRLERVAHDDEARRSQAESMRGQLAVASARVAYQIWKDVSDGPRFRDLAGKGAAAQRLLWASTGTKNPDYSDVKYVETLIGPETVNTMPLETLEAFRDHGRAERTLEQDVPQARRLLEQVPQVLGTSMDAFTQQLEDEGVAKFTTSWDRLMSGLQQRARAAGVTKGQAESSPR